MTTLIGVHEAAKRLDVPLSWVYRWSREKKLPSVRIGKYLKFDPVELERWIRQREENGR
jgi:excisionase family DNA binding protein